MLKAGIALLAWLVVFAMLIEAGDSEPRPISRCLTSLRIERGHKRNFTGKHRAIGLQIIFASATRIHPQAQGFVADKLGYPYGLIDSGILRLGAVKFVLVGEQLGFLFLLLVEAL